MSAISLGSLRKRYDDTVAVDGLDLTVPAGEAFGFLGPNGAGKSTTIDVMLGFTTPTDGSVTVLGHDAATESRAIRRRVGVLADGYSLYDRLTGREHVETAVKLQGSEDDPDAVLERVEMAHAAHRPVRAYSKGMRQRLALGMALVGSPDLLVFDEPSTGLDPTGVRRLREIVREEVDRGTTVFFSSHDLDQVEAVCDRVAILDQGRLVTVDTVEGLRDRLGAVARLRVDAEPVPDPETLTGIDGVSGATTEDGWLVVGCETGATKFRVLSEIDASDGRLIDFETDAASLEDLFTASLGAGAEGVSPVDGEAGDRGDGARTVET